MNIQEPDSRPGFYYVSIMDGIRNGRLSGPYLTHREALDDVTPVKVVAQNVDPRADFYAFGTMRSATDLVPGTLNKHNLFHI